MKFLNIKLILGTILVLGATSCGNKTAYNGNDSKLTTNLSDTVGYNNNNDGFNYTLDNSYTGYNGTNSYMTNDRMDYITDGNLNTRTSIVDYRGQNTARQLSNDILNNDFTNMTDNTLMNDKNNMLTNDTSLVKNDVVDNTLYNPPKYNTDYDMLLNDTYNNDTVGLDMNDVDEMVENGKVENNEMTTKNMKEAAEKTANDLNELADTTMDEVRDMTNTLRSDVTVR